jgi:hypothetical protein
MFDFIGNSAIKGPGIDITISKPVRERPANTGFTGTGRAIYGDQ